MEQFLIFFLIAVLIERFTEWLKQIFGKSLPEKFGNVSVYMLLSFGVAVIVTLALGADLFEAMGLTFKLPYMGLILTAWAVSGGANYLFDLLRSFRDPKPTEPAIIVIEEPKNVL